jgi:hypothetical protein
MNIALDYDDTWTAAPWMWEDFVSLAMSHGHSIKIVTFRSPDMPVETDFEHIFSKAVPVYYTSAVPKRRYMEEQGIPIAIWIDDKPELIVER